MFIIVSTWTAPANGGTHMKYWDGGLWRAAEARARRFASTAAARQHVRDEALSDVTVEPALER